MNFEDFKEKIKEEYNDVNSASIIEFEVPNDIELLKIYLAAKVFVDCGIEELHRQLNTSDDIEID